jgi:hypothetical protein
MRVQTLHRPAMSTDRGIILIASLLLCLFFFHRIQQIKKVWQAFGDVPAHLSLVSLIFPLHRFLPRIPWISAGVDFGWRNAYERRALLRILSSTQLMVCV